MQDALTMNWKKTLRRVDTFGDYTVSGFQYESEAGETGWQTTAWAIHRPVHDWVSSTRCAFTTFTISPIVI
jgi:hypothetical protein